MKKKEKTTRPRLLDRLCRLSRLSLYSLSLVWLAGCSAEEVEVDEGGSGGTGRTISFQVSVPGDAPSSKAISETDENAINNMYVLAFKVGSDGKETFDYCEPATYQSSTTWQVKVQKATHPQRFVVITGADTQVQALKDEASNKGKEKAELLATLKISNPGRWNANGSTFTRFPMWGESASLTVSSLTQSLGEIKLLRMVASIDVAVDAGAEGEFTLTSVYLYNTNTEGHIVPDATLLAAGKPTIPAGQSNAQQKLTYGGIDHTYDFSSGAAGKSMLRAIYTFESAVVKDGGGEVDREKTACLVIGGSYKSAKETFYRVDFVGSGDKYLDLLRNHKYAIQIKAVKGGGYTTPEEAVRSKSINMETEVLTWNQVGMNIIQTDGQYTLSVDKDVYAFAKEAKSGKDGENTLHVWTDFTTGWKVEDRLDLGTNQTAAWVNLSPESAVNSGKQPTETFIWLEENGTGSTRKAKIILAAGRLRKEIQVEQSSAPKVVPKSIKILHVSNGNAVLPDNHELVFMPKKTGFSTHTHTFKVVWEPDTEKMRVSVSGTCSLLDGAPVHGREHNTGEKLYTVTTKDLSTTGANGTALPTDHVSSVTFTTESGKSQTIKLRQRNYGLIYSVRPKYASSTSKTYTFEVKSNTTWEIEAVTDGSGVLTAASKTALEKTKGGTADMVTTTPVSFTVAQGKTGTATLRFGNPEGLFADVEVELNVQPSVPAEYGGSNIVWIEDSTKPYGGYLTFSTGPEDKSIDARSQGVYFKWGSLVAISGQGAQGSAFALSHILFTGEYTTPIGSWAAIPFADGSSHTYSNGSQFTNSVQTDDDFDGFPNGSGPGYKADRGVGDICRYISDKGWVEGSWRLPTSAEQEALCRASGVSPVNNSYWGTPVGGSSNWNYITSDRKNGEFLIPSYVQLSQQWFPAAGYRDTDGALYDVGSYAYYWSGSSNGSGACLMHVYSHGAYWGYYSYRQDGFSVRCVRE